jgi:hypothetical protein
MHVVRTILALVLALAVAALPLPAASMTLAGMGHAAAAQSVDDCHGGHHHHAALDKTTDKSKPSDNTSCALGCAGMCWTNAVVSVQHVLLGRVDGVVGPLMAEDPALPHVASPPFRPPRV